MAAIMPVPSFVAKAWLSAITFFSSGLYRVPSGKMTRYICGEKSMWNQSVGSYCTGQKGISNIHRICWTRNTDTKHCAELITYKENLRCSFHWFILLNQFGSKLKWKLSFFERFRLLRLKFVSLPLSLISPWPCCVVGSCSHLKICFECILESLTSHLFIFWRMLTDVTFSNETFQ